MMMLYTVGYLEELATVAYIRNVPFHITKEDLNPVSWMLSRQYS